MFPAVEQKHCLLRVEASGFPNGQTMNRCAQTSDLGLA